MFSSRTVFPSPMNRCDDHLGENGEWIIFPSLHKSSTSSQSGPNHPTASHPPDKLDQTDEVVTHVAVDCAKDASDTTTSTLEGGPPILKLPTEILQHIASYLSSDYKACLSLTCKQMLYIIGSKSWTALTRPSLRNTNNSSDSLPPLDQRLLLSFLECLSRDSSTFALCRCCMRLHEVDPPCVTENYFLHRQRRCVEHHGLLWYPTKQDEGYAITGAHVVKALHISSNLGNSDSAIDFLTGKATIPDRNGRMDYSLSFSARMVKGNLIQRIEHTITPKQPTSWYQRGLFALPVFAVHSVPIRICRHHFTVPTARPWDVANTVGSLFPAAIIYATPKKAFWAWRAEWMRELVFKRVKSANKYWITEDNQVDRCKQQDGLLYVWGCVQCATKFRVEWIGRTLKIVVWKNFGSDKALGKAWKSHVGKTPNLGRTHSCLDFKTGEEESDEPDEAECVQDKHEGQLLDPSAEKNQRDSTSL
jgi:hypothetical protein